MRMSHAEMVRFMHCPPKAGLILGIFMPEFLKRVVDFRHLRNYIGGAERMYYLVGSLEETLIVEQIKSISRLSIIGFTV